jgi:hypothetical protein
LVHNTEPCGTAGFWRQELSIKAVPNKVRFLLQDEEMGSAPETSPQIKIMIVNVKKLLILFEI